MQDEFIDQLLLVLKAHSSTDNNIQQESLQINQQLQRYPDKYVKSLIYICNSYPEYLNLGLILAKNYITSNWNEISPEFHDQIQNDLCQLFPHLGDTQQVKLFIELCKQIFKLQESNWPQFIDLISSVPEFPFQIQLAVFQELITFPEILTLVVDAALTVVIQSFQMNDWHVRLAALQIFGVVGVLEDEDSQIQYWEYIINILSETTSLSDDLFMAVWNEISVLTESAEIPEQYISSFCKIIIDLVSNESLSAFLRSILLDIISNIKENLDKDLIAQLLSLTFNLATIIIQENDFPKSLDIFEQTIDIFGSSEIFLFIKNQMSEQNIFSIIISIHLFTLLIDKIEVHLRSDWEFISDIIKQASNIEHEQLIEEICNFISELTPFFSKQLIKSNLFLEQTIPMLIHSSPNIRQVAKNAVFKSISNVSIPIPNLISHLWEINNEINPDDCYDYLTLLARAIENQSYTLTSEISLQLCEYLLPYLQGDNTQLFVGAMSVAMVLLKYDESVNDFLYASMINAIDTCLESESEDLLLFLNGLRSIEQLVPLYVDVFSAKYTPKIIELISNNNESEVVLERAIICGSSIAKESNNQELLSLILDRFNRILAENKFDYFEFVFLSLRMIAKIINPPDLTKLYNQIINFVSQTSAKDNYDNIVDCIDVLNDILSIVNDNNEIYESSQNLIQQYLKGELPIHPSNPIEGIIDFNLLRAFTGLMCEAIRFQSEVVHEIFSFATNLAQTDSTDLIDLSFCIFGPGIEYGAFNEAEIEFVKSVVFNFLVEEIEIDLVHNMSYVLSVLISSNLLKPETILPYISIFSNWWTRCYDTELITASNLAVFIWIFSLKSSEFHKELLVPTFSQYPPADTDELERMSELLIEFANNSICIENVIEAIVMILSLPCNMHQIIKISSQTVQKLVLLLKSLSQSEEMIEIFNSACKKLNSEAAQTRVISYLQ